MQISDKINPLLYIHHFKVMNFIVINITIRMKGSNFECKTHESIFIDDSPIIPTNFVFDETYRNVTDRKKFQNNRKYAYFNTLIKMKNDMHTNPNKNKSELYKYIFEPDIESEFHDKQSQKIQDIFQQPRLMNQSKRMVHVQKLNKNVYKIHKNGSFNRMHATAKGSRVKDLDANNISFQLHFKQNLGRQNQSHKNSRSLIKTSDALQINSRKHSTQKSSSNIRSLSVGGHQKFGNILRKQSNINEKYGNEDTVHRNIKYLVKDFKSRNSSNKNSISPNKFIPYNKQQIFGVNSPGLQSKQISNYQIDQKTSKMLQLSKKQAMRTSIKIEKKQEHKEQSKMKNKKQKSKLLRYLQKMQREQKFSEPNIPLAVLQK